MKKLAGFIPLGPPGGFKGQGPLGNFIFGSAAIDLFAKVISLVIGIITVIAGIWFVFKLIIGAVGIISSGGDKAKLAEARENITYGIIGFVVVIAGIFIADLVGTLLGFPILDIANSIINLTP